jgi:transglutaminase-like putative cysteine protease
VAVTYRVTHRTAYRYETDVGPSFSQLRVQPRDLAHQRCVSTEVTVEPEPTDYREWTDFFGNRVAYFAIESPHRALTVTAVSVVEIDGHDDGLPLFGDEPWERTRDDVRRHRDPVAVEASAFVLDSPLVCASVTFADYARASFTPGRRFVEAVTDLTSRIHRDFAFKPGSTKVTTTLEEVFEQREGVCQDFAHVAIACLRSLGLAARYVSGYLETDPPRGRPKLVGRDVSHAWASVYVPAVGWIGIDPTNDRFVGGRYVTTAWGRDYSDVPPLNGVIFTNGGTASLDVEVDVVALRD